MSSRKTEDIWLFAVAAALLVIGLFMVFDASYALAGQSKSDSMYFLKRQALFGVIGLVLMFAVRLVPYWKFKPLGAAFLVASIVLLALVFVPGFGVTINGAKRWISLGPIQVQPSEFAKLGIVVYLASVLSTKKREIHNWKSELLPLIFPVGAVSFLVVKEDMGTAIVLVVTVLGMLYLAGVRKRHIATTIAVLVPMGVGFICSESYRIHRITSFLDPFKEYHGSGYQICQSLIAIGSGGIFGAGLCEGKQKLFYLPIAYADFIYAVYCQETGLIGSCFLALLFVVFAWRGFRIAGNCKDSFGRLLAAGISTMIAFQALLNMYVVTSMIPNTGVPLPFISYGGSSLALNLVCVGILLGISRHPRPLESNVNESRSDRGRNRRPRVSGAKYR